MSLPGLAELAPAKCIGKHNDKKEQSRDESKSPKKTPTDAIVTFAVPYTDRENGNRQKAEQQSVLRICPVAFIKFFSILQVDKAALIL